ncbi:hypothetical protein MTR67_048262 [Solanum verrucosum]|uniref:Tf2-1-like SH3-like domain-containing protein n=1 Tax=Solanum verrucosum TaxID=315347 RepID=A0AAF0UY44_SOLVR|nr:hypothetical protein MTR67_048262 [Solanum verrucosum]
MYREVKRARTGDVNFSNAKSDGHGRSWFKQKFSNQGSSNAYPRVNKDRVSNPKPQGGNSGGSHVNRPNCAKYGKSHKEDEKKELVRDMHRLARLDVQLVDSTKSGVMVHNGSKSSFVMDVKSKQGLDPILLELKESVLKKSVEAFSQGGDGVLSYQGPEVVYDAIEKVQLIKERLKMTQSRQHSYADMRRRDLEFDVNDLVYLKISHMKGMMRFGKKGNLNPQYVGPYQFLIRIGKVAYELVSIIPLKGLGVDESLSYEEVLLEILDRQVKRFRKK